MTDLEAALKHFDVVGKFSFYFPNKGLGFNCQTENVFLETHSEKWIQNNSSPEPLFNLLGTKLSVFPPSFFITVDRV